MVGAASRRARGPAARLLTTLAATLGAVALGTAPATASETDWPGLRVLNIAHQGGENEAPSNTMYALDRAMRLGSDMLELDIHTSSDDQLMVMHDSTVDRTTNGTGSVYDMTAEEIQALDAGYNLVPGEGTVSGGPESDYPFRGVRTGDKKPPPGFRPRDFRIPILDEVMRAYPDVPINIEIKGSSDEDVESFLHNAEVLAAYLNDLGRTDGIVVASFNDAALARFHQLAPDIDLAPGTAAVGAYKASQGNVTPPEGTKVFQVPIDFSGVPVTDEQFVDWVHEDGYAIHIWTIDDEPTMEQLLGWGVDGIMTAEPSRLEKVLCENDIGRPARPQSSPGRHCSRRASIACDVTPTAVVRHGDDAVITLERHDEFDSRCAGRVALSGIGGPRPKGSRFNFGWKPPSADGPGVVKVAVGLSPANLSAIGREGEAVVKTRPWRAFVGRERLPVG